MRAQNSETILGRSKRGQRGKATTDDTGIARSAAVSRYAPRAVSRSKAPYGALL